MIFEQHPLHFITALEKTRQPGKLFQAPPVVFDFELYRIPSNMYSNQRFGSVIFLTDPDPTLKPKTDPDPDPGTVI